MMKSIRICGFGGQGVILAGFIVGKSATVFMDYHAVQSQSYGPEARGGACVSDIVISDKKIGYPRPTEIDCLIAMSQEAYNKYHKDTKKDTVIIIDPELVREYDTNRKHYKIHAQQIAESLGNRIVTNIVMIGAFTGIYKLLEYDAVKKSVVDSVPKKFITLNVDAFERGYEAGKNAIPE